MFIRNTWYVAGFEHEFDQPFIARRILDTPLIMYRTSLGQYTAMDDSCPHRLLPLSKGKRVGDEMQCGYHGMCFSADGQCTKVPGQTNIPSAARVKTYPLEALHGFVWIWMGDADLADKGLIPDVHWHSSPDWASSQGYHHIEAHYTLLNDNLLDLSHETYVHSRTIGNDEEESIAGYTAKVTAEHGCLVRAHREMRNIEAPPFFELVIGRPCQINRWQSAIHLVPSINLTVVGVHPIEEDRTAARIGHVLHLLTPESETGTHYFWAFVRNYRLDNADLTEGIRKASSSTFDEDKEVLEIQQQQMERRKTAVPNVAIKLDEAPIRARRLLEQRAAQEASNPRHVVAPPALVPEHSFAVLEEA
ncbi:aromatic ring-hydroxylating dioxygenase subunit alpha [Pusillimonas sp.]|uniref:aromatic ring-hydroxylating dioxygenase subunit alpha n=1 Tax=Pusillimonas sp. TaxID=3040095 RepID=UPI0029AA64A6|nr:aromatic ring-hydroxylating dioxygenase subunit alpha [Pusillimonas sp.]MDX3894454.1 aromatic ring-hydroxylating dioxygenase subunit alpha [Pusillimonas sp.]